MAVLLAPKESLMLTTHTMAKLAEEKPAGRRLEAKLASDMPVTGNVMLGILAVASCPINAVPSSTPNAVEGAKKLNWKDIGTWSSTHELAANWKLVFSSVPVTGATEKSPGSGGPLVTTLIEAWPTLTSLVPNEHVRVNIKDVRWGNTFAPITRLVAVVTVVGERRTEVGTNATALRSIVASLTDHEHSPATIAVVSMDPDTTSLVFVLTAVAKFDPMETMGASLARIVIVVVVEADRVPADTVNVITEDDRADCGVETPLSKGKINEDSFSSMRHGSPYAGSTR